MKLTTLPSQPKTTPNGKGCSGSEARTLQLHPWLNKPSNMDQLYRVMGTMLETWEQRYLFAHDLQEHKITFTVPGFTLTVIEEIENDNVALLFEKAGTKHKVVCSTDEAPKIIEALLFPEADGQ